MNGIKLRAAKRVGKIEVLFEALKSFNGRKIYASEEDERLNELYSQEGRKRIVTSKLRDL